MAEASGDVESMLEWEKRLAAFRKDRHGRRIDMIKVFCGAAGLQLPKLLLGPFLVLAAIGTRCSPSRRGNIDEVATPFRVVATVAEIVAITLSVSWGPVVLAIPWIAVGALWWTGKSYAGAGPGWARTSMDSGRDIAIDETTIARALEALRIPQICST